MSKVRVGVVGCGAIAQVQHVPNLLELNELFEVPIVCDVAPGQAEYLARRFNLDRGVSDIDELLAADVDAVLLCHGDPKTEYAVKAFEAGKHVLVEKPVCHSLDELDAMLAGQDRAGTVGQAAYMKAYDPAYEMGKREIASMDFTFVQANHLHPSNYLHLDHFDVQYVARAPADLVEANREAMGRCFERSCPELNDTAKPVWDMANGLIHDLYSIRNLIGIPNAVKGAELWKDSRAITVILEYPNAARCVLSRVDLEELWDFRQTVEVFGDDKRVLLGCPTGFSRRVLSTMVVQGIDADGTSYRKEPAIPWESAFVGELRHFHDCIVNGARCRTPLEDVRHDLQLIIDITHCHATSQPVHRSSEV